MKTLDRERLLNLRRKHRGGGGAAPLERSEEREEGREREAIAADDIVKRV